MVGTLKSKSSRSLAKNDVAVLLPGATEAEPWELWVLDSDGSSECVQTCATPMENHLRRRATLAFPVAEVFCLSMWLNETDPARLKDMVSLQIELRGLRPRGQAPAIFETAIVAQEKERTLVMSCVLPGILAPSLQAENYVSFDISPRYFAFPKNALILWLEQGRLVLAATRDEQLVYFQALPDATITTRVLQDVNCARATLAMQGILVSPQSIELWMPAGATEMAALKEALALPVRQNERPAPRKPSNDWNLTPSTVHETQRNRARGRWRNWGIALAVGIYLLLVAFLISRFAITSTRVETLRKWSTAHAQDVAMVRETRAEWQALAPVVDETRYPLETLLHVSEAIPADELHLTSFEVDGPRLLIKGEAKNVSEAFQFSSALKHDSRLSVYTLEMNQPTLLPNDLAKFQIEGSREN